MEQFLQREWTPLEHWMAAGVVLAAGWGGGLLVVQLLLKKMGRIASRTGSPVDDRMIGALSFPLRALMFFTAALVAIRLTPLYPKESPFFALAFKVVFLLGGILLAEVFLQGLLRGMENRRTEIRNSHVFLSTILRMIVWGIGSMMILGALGIPITPLLASLGVGSLAVALALQPTLTNFFSGFYLLLDKPIRAGDFIQLESGEEGYVESIGWRTTRVKLLPNNMVILPNSRLAESHILNYHLPDKECAVLVQAGVDYDSDLVRVEKVTVEVARGVQESVLGAVRGFEPFIRYHTFADSSINFTVILRAREFTDNYLVKHEFVKRLHEAYRKEGITIPFPQRTVEFRGGQRPPEKGSGDTGHGRVD